MSTRRQLWQALGLVATLSLSAAAIGADGVGRLATYEKAPGEAYFALSVMPKVAADAAQTNEVVVLFDTSASAAGAFRDDAMTAMNTLLRGLGKNDRVKLMAVDMKAVPMTDTFVAVGSPELQAGLTKLQQRAPLGATDLSLALRTAAGSYSDAGSARTVVYLGDGMSKANMMTDAVFAQLVDDLRKDRVTVSSFVIGQERNVATTAALANHTGGIVATDGDAANIPAASGTALANSIHASVIWPTRTSLPTAIANSFPASTPPLRTDRDSVLIGKLGGSGEGEVKIEGEMNGQPVEIAVTVTPEKSSEDFSFLPKMVELAETDGGMSLPTVGSVGLREAALVTLASADSLAKLAHEALSAGNFAGARQAAEAALARDPNHPEAKTILAAAKKGRSAAPAAPKSAEPELKLAGGEAAPKVGGSLLEEVLAEPSFLGDVQKDRDVRAGLVQAQVENGLNEARSQMNSAPELAEQNLKLLMEQVERAPDLDAAVRAQLREQIETAIRQARREGVLVANRRAEAESARAGALEAERALLELSLKEQRLKQIMDRFDSLMDEGRFAVAINEVTPEVLKLAPNTPIAESVSEGGRLQQAVTNIKALWVQRQKAFVDTMYQVELSQVPFPDEPPIVYPPAQQWEELSLRRKKYAAVDLARRGGSEERIFQELNRPTTMEFVETPLKDAIDFMANQHNIPIVLNAKKLEEAGVAIDTPVTKNLKGISLRSALRLLLNEMELTYVVRDEVLQITTPEDAESQLITKVYPVGDLVLPIGVNSNLFGLGGVGGMNGGGGMMGGGMGGMGGGMGGMGGGMGGGFFAVPDELKLGAKKTVAPAQPVPSAQAIPAEQPRVQRPAAAKPAVRLSVQTAAGESAGDAWDRYFGEQKARFEGLSDPIPARREMMASVRETVRHLMHEKKYAEIPPMILSALRNGQVEPWMYEAMGLAMQADLGTFSQEDLERTLLSAVDFASSEDEILFIAGYMTKCGLERRALSLFRQLGDNAPSRPEPFLQGLALAKKLNDADAIQWGCIGILRQAWTGEQRTIADGAYRTALATYEDLMKQNRKDEAKALDAAVRQAQQRDCVVIVTWTGDADIDLSVQEPAGTMCSLRQPRTVSGGVHMGDMAAGSGVTTAKGLAEAYVCPEAFSGEYRVQLRNVWGRPTSGKVTIDIYTNYGTDKQRLIHEQIPLGEKNAVCVFNVEEGRRKDALPEAQVAQVANIQNAVNRAVLAQQLAGLDNSEAARNFAAAMALAGRRGFFGPGAVGYRPVIEVLPEGANFSTNGVISADRRYVRVAPAPTFSQVTEVSTFNFVTGMGTTQQQQGNGFGGGAGGGGGFGGGGMF